MVLLPNSGELARRYAPYIQELQEFFALHDLRCGSPRELGFLAARLSGRDSFPAELASMVRSFIFREGGSVPLSDLLTVVALAVGGPAAAEFAPGLQHPLTDLSSFLASVARAPLDQPPSAPAANERDAAEGPVPSSKVSLPPVDSPAHSFAEPAASASPFLPPHSSDTALAPATFAGSEPKPNQPAVIRRAAGDPAGRSGLWVALAVGVPLLLLAVLLFRQFNPPAEAPLTSSANPVAQSNVPASPPPSTSISAPLAAPQTPLAAAAAALAQPNSSSSLHPLGPSSFTSGKSRASVGPSAQAPATPTPTPAPESPVNVAAASTPRADIPVPATAPPVAVPAPSKSAEAASGPSHVPPAHTPATGTSVASVTAQQGAFGISSGIMSSHLISSSQPKYPKMAGFTHAEGQVILQAVVSKTGRVSAVKVLSGPRSLRKAAEKSVRQWRYRPYIADGRPADVATIITIDFKAPH